MKLTDFDYHLPKELIAQYPLKTRDASRMMILDREKRTIGHKLFKDITSYLKKGDTVVLNDSKVVPARLICKRETGGKAEIFILKKIKKNIYQALTKPASKLFPGKKLFSEDGSLLAEVVENREVGKLIKFADVVNIEKELKRLGQVPLPPYIKRKPEASDEDRYQTVYAKREGSTASPTAGLHFTKKVLDDINRRGVNISYVTLHVSYGTFAPVKVEDVRYHKMHKEYFELPRVTQEVVEKTRRGSGRVLAVGTTTARVLEDNVGNILCTSGRKDACARKDLKSSTSLFIYPPYKFKMANMMLTNFHLPKSTLLMLVSAFAGREYILKAYREAVEKKYRFYSYGDCMLII